jgi:hypothetical protein
MVEGFYFLVFPIESQKLALPKAQVLLPASLKMACDKIMILRGYYTTSILDS